MIGGDGRLQRGIHVDLAVGGDFEDGAGTVTHVEVLLFVETHARGHAHAFHKDGHAAGGGDLIDHAFEAAGDVDEAVVTNGDGGRIHHVADEGAHVEVEIDAVDGDGNFLAAGAGESGVDVAKAVYGGAGDGVQIFADGDADIAAPDAAGLAALGDDKFTGGSAFGHFHDDEGVGTDDDRGLDRADSDEGAFHGLAGSETGAADVQFAARDGCFRHYIGDEGGGAGGGWFAN